MEKCSYFVACFLLWFFSLNLCAGSPECGGYRDVPVTPAKISLRTRSFIESSPGIKKGTLLACERVCIPGLQRFQNIIKYAHSRRVEVQMEHDEGGSKKSSSKTEVCFHRNMTVGLGQCQQHEWKSLENGLWTSFMSPFQTKFIDIRMADSVSETFIISVEEVFRPYRLGFLAIGLVILLSAPIVSKWVPFYYSSAMAFGVILVILIILFQGMKLLPTGRKSTLYVIFYGSIVGIGSWLISYLSNLAQSILNELGFGEDMLNPVFLFLLVCIVLSGAWLGFYGVRKLVLREDGSVDAGTAYFVEWSLRIIAACMILQSSHDSLLATLMLFLGGIFTTAVRSLREYFCTDEYDSPRRSRTLNHSKVEFVSRYTDEKAHFMRSQNATPNWSSFMENATLSPITPKWKYTSSPEMGSQKVSHARIATPNSSIDDEVYYSSYHKNVKRKHFSKKEWEDFTKASTDKAVKDLMATPEFAEWALQNTNRIQTTPLNEREENLSQKRRGGWFSW